MNIDKSFHIHGLPTVYHTPDTFQAFEDNVDTTGNGDFKTQSQFVAMAIVKQAERLGFEVGNKKATSPKRESQIRIIESKSRCVAYDYLWAFEYLQLGMPLVKKSTLLRIAILAA